MAIRLGSKIIDSQNIDTVPDSISGGQEKRSLNLLDLSNAGFNNTSFTKDLDEVLRIDLSNTGLHNFTTLKKLIGLKVLRVRDNHLKDTDLLTLKHLSGLIILDRSKNILNDSDFVCKQWKSRVTALDISENDVGHINIDNNCFHNPYASKSGIRSIQTVDAALTRFIYVAGNNMQDISFLNKIPLLGYTHFHTNPITKEQCLSQLSSQSNSFKLCEKFYGPGKPSLH